MRAVLANIVIVMVLVLFCGGVAVAEQGGYVYVAPSGKTVKITPANAVPARANGNVANYVITAKFSPKHTPNQEVTPLFGKWTCVKNGAELLEGDAAVNVDVTAPINADPTKKEYKNNDPMQWNFSLIRGTRGSGG